MLFSDPKVSLLANLNSRCWRTGGTSKLLWVHASSTTEVPGLRKVFVQRLFSGPRSVFVHRKFLYGVLFLKVLWFRRQLIAVDFQATILRCAGLVEKSEFLLLTKSTEVLNLAQILRSEFVCTCRALAPTRATVCICAAIFKIET